MISVHVNSKVSILNMYMNQVHLQFADEENKPKRQKSSMICNICIERPCVCVNHISMDECVCVREREREKK